MTFQSSHPNPPKRSAQLLTVVKTSTHTLCSASIVTRWCNFIIWIVLTFRRLASYPVGRHLNISALLEVLPFRSLGQPQPQPFKYFPLNIFREISLILSTTLEVFPASCSDWSTHWEKTNSIHFLYEAVCTQPVRLLCVTIYSLFFLLHSFGWWMTYYIAWVRDHVPFGL